MTTERNVKGILGTKLGMTQLWDDNNNVVPVTVIQAGPCVVTQVRTPETDGYNAVQLGFGAIKSKQVTKPYAGLFAAADVTPASTWWSSAPPMPASTPWARSSPWRSSRPARASTSSARARARAPPVS